MVRLCNKRKKIIMKEFCHKYQGYLPDIKLCDLVKILQAKQSIMKGCHVVL